jgi:hypothetical protein
LSGEQQSFPHLSPQQLAVIFPLQQPLPQQDFACLSALFRGHDFASFPPQQEAASFPSPAFASPLFMREHCAPFMPATSPDIFSQQEHLAFSLELADGAAGVWVAV